MLSVERAALTHTIGDGVARRGFSCSWTNALRCFAATTLRAYVPDAETKDVKVKSDGDQAILGVDLRKPFQHERPS
jgi:hypothetical protein